MTSPGTSSTAFAAPDGRWAEIEASPRPASLDQLLAEAVDEHRDERLFDLFEDGISLTYGEFDSLVDRVAGVLAELGVGPRDHVGLLLPNVALYPAAFLALARLGAVYVPINSRLTGPEIDHVCSEADIAFIVVHEDLREALDASEAAKRLGPERIFITGLSRGTAASGVDLDPLVDDAVTGGSYSRHHHATEDLVSILFTSGSTGLPKGCMHTPEYWLILAQTFTSLGPNDGSDNGRSLLDTPFSYMTGPSNTVGALMRGGCVVMAKTPTLSGYIDRLREQNIGSSWFPEVLLKTPERDGDADHPVRRAFVESLPDRDYEVVERRFGIVVRPCFAMTEIGMGTLVPWDDDRVSATGIGIPGPFRECMVVGADQRPVEDGTVGELCVRGPGIFRGYYKRDAVNAESFLEGGWFRTGDLVYREADGRFFYVGRAKAMVRRAGEQISSQEVEMALREMPEIAEAAVVPVPDEFRDEEVKAYVILADGLTPDDATPEQIEAWCRGRLAPFKVPRYIEYRDELPRTPSEKVAKPVLLKEKDDLRLDSHDRVDEVWR